MTQGARMVPQTYEYRGYVGTFQRGTSTAYNRYHILSIVRPDGSPVPSFRPGLPFDMGWTIYNGLRADIGSCVEHAQEKIRREVDWDALTPAERDARIAAFKAQPLF